jgi:uncharacterized protein YbbC (DUF1343 family)
MKTHKCAISNFKDNISCCSLPTKVKTGLDILVDSDFALLEGANIGLVVNQASVNSELIHAIDLFVKTNLCSLKAIFGPQHGIYGTTQANMIEFDHTEDNYLNLPIYSLYGEHRKPLKEMLEGIDALVVDLPDIGARYYTYLWTAKLCMEACSELGIKMYVLDRPNPLGGVNIEGPILDKEYKSFVGLSEIPVRHSCTMGELLLMISNEENIPCKLEVIKASNWSREMLFSDTGLPWVLPSPNMPTLDTALVYPGFCLLEATNISEGRGTCRPFEFCGAPFIDSRRIVKQMNEFNLPGVFFRSAYFEPTFDKYQGEMCGGFQMHVTDRDSFLPVKTAAAFILAVKMLYGNKFSWNDPPYEYEYEKPPIDILWGNREFRELVDRYPVFGTIDKIDALLYKGIDDFRKKMIKYLLYS